MMLRICIFFLTSVVISGVLVLCSCPFRATGSEPVGSAPNPTPPEVNIDSPSPSGRIKKSEWKPAVYRGLQVGTATAGQLITILGDPITRAKLESGGEIYRFASEGEVSGNIDVFVNGKIIELIAIHPDRLFVSDLAREFSGDYVVTRYSPNQCDYKDDGYTIHEDENGELEFLEYRELGIAVVLNQNNDLPADKVDRIEYRSSPVGFERPQCP